VAIFGRKTARQRLRRATRESLTIPAFSSPVDCTPWVTGGLWPAELSTVTDETAALAEYLRADLQRIADAANIELRNIKRAVLADSVRQAEEARVINSARAFATRRVESTVRHLRKAVPEWPTQYLHLTNSDHTDSDATQRLAPRDHGGDRQRGEAGRSGSPRDHSASVPAADVSKESIDSAPEMASTMQPEVDEVDRPAPPAEYEPDVRDVADEAAPGRRPEPAAPGPAPEVPSARHAAAPVDDVVTVRESDQERLQRLLKFVARQEPGLRWAVGDRADGTTVVVTDLAHGWIPSGIMLPAGVRLLTPERRSGNATALLGQTTRSVAYTPGGVPLGWAAEFDAVEPSLQPRELPMVDDLGWLLSEATHWRDGLPRMVHTLAKAGAARTGIMEAEIDVLRVHLDTARYQLLAQYPDVDAALLLNCLLLAASERTATGDTVSANYHFAWFQMLSAPPVSRWTANP
jgi:Family of unknown function (DUF5631)/Family of unknown function (DUF5632)